MAGLIFKVRTKLKKMRANNFIDLTGTRFGRLKVLELYDVKCKKPYWKTICDCGNLKIVAGNNLKRGHTRSCGCLFKETRIKPKHGLSNTPFYNIYNSMKHRVGKLKNYENVKLCERWRDFNNFIADMYDPYIEHVNKYGRRNTSIERINNLGDYEPSNCKWATIAIQQRNTRRNNKIVYNGKVYCFQDLANEFNINFTTLYSRLKAGLSLDKALTLPKNYCFKLLTYEGKTMSYQEWDKYLNLCPGTVGWRFKKGWPLNKVLSSVSYSNHK